MKWSQSFLTLIREKITVIAELLNTDIRITDKESKGLFVYIESQFNEKNSEIRSFRAVGAVGYIGLKSDCMGIHEDTQDYLLVLFSWSCVLDSMLLKICHNRLNRA